MVVLPSFRHAATSLMMSSLLHRKNKADGSVDSNSKKIRYDAGKAFEASYVKKVSMYFVQMEI